MRTPIFCAVLLLTSGSVALGNGVLRINGSRNQSAVRLTAHRVQAQVRDAVARVTVEQVFHNDSGRRLEGVYTFPLPGDATVSDFAMTMGGKMVQGEVLERKKAKRVYEGIVRRKRDPGLLEQVERGVFRARVFPIEPRQDLTIRIVYQQILPDSAGTLELRYPLAKERMNASSVQSTSIVVDVESTIDLKAVYCPSHKTEITRDGTKKARVSWEQGEGGQDRDFLLYVGRSPDAVGFTLLSSKAPAEAGTFLAIFAPPTRVKAEDALPKDVVYVLDTSGSMEGPKIEQAKAALSYGIRKLQPKDRFNIVAFSSGTKLFREQLVEVTDETRAAALTWVSALQANGGTALDDALQAALRFGTEDRLGVVALLTDGLPTIGETSPDRIVERVKETNRSQARVFVFGIGFDQNVKLLDRVADATRAAREYITPKQDIEVVVSRFFNRIDQPVLTDLRLELGSGVSEVYPRRLPDLFAGDQLVVLGRYDTAGPRRIQLHGKVLGKDVTHDYEGSLVEHGGAESLDRLWAQRKIDFLLVELGLRGHNKELVDEVVRLGTKHSIVTPYTAGLVVEDEAPITEEVVQENADAPFAGPSNGSAIGLGGGAGGGRGGVGGRSRRSAKRGSDLGADEAPPSWAIVSALSMSTASSSRTLHDAPFSGPLDNSAIGVGGGAGPGPRGLGGRARKRARGGSGMTENAVELGLKWLADHQDASDGGWEHDLTATGLSVLSFLGAGYTDRGTKRDNPHASTVRQGLRFLAGKQNEQGRFRAEELVAGHAIATLALAEAWAMTRNPRYKKVAQQGLNFLAHARNPYLAWGKKPRDGTNDTETTLWCLLALRAGKFGGLDVDPDAFEGARTWLAESKAAFTIDEAASVLVGRILLGEDPRKSLELKALTARCLKYAPTDLKEAGYLHLATLGLFQVGGARWKAWNRAVIGWMTKQQRPGGSWDRPGADAHERVRTTALLTMCLEVYYRYDRVFGLR